MLNKVKTLATAAALTVALPIASFAATINGQIDITGNVSDFDVTSGATLSENGIVTIATGDFGSFATAFLSIASLTDVDFNSPGEIWSVAGFTFTATSFLNIASGAANTFTALGTIAGNGFDETDGSLYFTAQNDDVEVSFSSTTTAVPVPAAGLLLIAGIGALGVAGRRKKAA